MQCKYQAFMLQRVVTQLQSYFDHQLSSSDLNEGSHRITWMGVCIMSFNDLICPSPPSRLLPLSIPFSSQGLESCLKGPDNYNSQVLIEATVIALTKLQPLLSKVYNHCKPLLATAKSPHSVSLLLNILHETFYLTSSCQLWVVCAYFIDVLSD